MLLSLRMREQPGARVAARERKRASRQPSQQSAEVHTGNQLTINIIGEVRKEAAVLLHVLKRDINVEG